MPKSNNSYDQSVRSINDADRYEMSGESEYSRERSDPYQMVDYLIDREVNFRGIGPKNYVIPDEKIRDDVCELLARDSRIDASEIEVDVKEGCVFLRGDVDSRRTKRLAQLVIEDLPGIEDIFNQLKIPKPEAFH